MFSENETSILSVPFEADLSNVALTSEATRVMWEETEKSEWERIAVKVELYGQTMVVPISARETKPEPEKIAGRKPLTLLVIGGGASTDMGNVGMAETAAAQMLQNPGYYISNMIVLPNVEGIPRVTHGNDKSLTTENHAPVAHVLLEALKQIAINSNNEAFKVASKDTLIMGFSNGGAIATWLSQLLLSESTTGKFSQLNASWNRPGYGQKLHQLNTHPESFAERPQIAPNSVDLLLIEPASMIDRNELALAFWFVFETALDLPKIGVKEMWRRIRTAWVTPKGIPKNLSEMLSQEDNVGLARKFGIVDKLVSPGPSATTVSRDNTRIARENSQDNTVVLVTLLGGKVLPLVDAARKLVNNLAVSDKLALQTLSRLLFAKAAQVETVILDETYRHAHPMFDPTVIQRGIDAYVMSKSDSQNFS